MIIVHITEFFSEQMGYSENCLPKAMAALGHEVHLIASDLQVYGNLPDYEKTYGRYLGPRFVPCEVKEVDGFWLHRMPHRIIGGYVDIKGLLSKLLELKPDVVQVHSCASPIALKLALARNIMGYRLYSECHQHLSVVNPLLRDAKGSRIRKAQYFVTRTLPGSFISRLTTRCYPVSEDCAFVAHKYYGVQQDRIRIMPLGSDTHLFYPVGHNDVLQTESEKVRKSLGVSETEVLCIYTGRFSKDKNPLLLAKAISRLNGTGHPFKALFIGSGAQTDEIQAFECCKTILFVPFRDLPKYYRAADIGVWPMQESLSMLDAAACGIPIVVSDHMGDMDRVVGNGAVYKEGDVEDLAGVLHALGSKERRKKLGEVGRAKVVEKYSWIQIAEDLLEEYEAFSGRKAKALHSSPT